MTTASSLLLHATAPRGISQRNRAKGTKATEQRTQGDRAKGTKGQSNGHKGDRAKGTKGTAPKPELLLVASSLTPGSA